MKRIAYRQIAKGTWGVGPWVYEDDKVQFEDPLTGHPCVIVRDPNFGHLTGCVGLGPDHPWFAKDDLEIPILGAHRGITVADFAHHLDRGEELSVNVKAEPGEEDYLWFVGFTCDEHGDFTPMLGRYKDTPVGRAIVGEGEVYRDIQYVKKELTKLAQACAHAEVEAQEGAEVAQ